MEFPTDLPTMHTAISRYVATFLYTLRGRRHCFGTPHYRTNQSPTSVRHWIVVGLRVIISGTGGAAHVPGMVADGHDTSSRHWFNLSRRRHCPG
jgi:phosphoribosylcarboxyaminoimidazole (NCAIR) mutase